MSDIGEPGDGGTAMSSPREPRHRWLPWTIVGGVAAVAVAAAFVVVPVLDEAPPAAQSASTPRAPAPQPSDPEEPVCTVTSVDAPATNPRRLDLPVDGVFTPVYVADMAGEFVSNVAIDEQRTAVLSRAYENEPTEMIVIDRTSGRVVWRIATTPSTSILSTPALTGLPDVVVTSTPTEDAMTSVLTAHDPATGEVLRTAEVAGGWVGAIRQDEGLAGDARAGRPDDAALFVTNSESAMRLDGSSLAVEWTITGADHGVDEFEGGVPFSIVGDVFFAGGKAFDARTGDTLGWETEKQPFSAARHALVTPIVYDSPDPYVLSGLDLRTGEACWSIEVVSVAAQSDHLWVVTTDEVLRRIDPETGDTLDEAGTVGYAQVEVLGDLVMTSPRSWEPDVPRTMTVRSPAGIWERDSADDGAPLQESHGQLLVTRSGTVDSPGELIAHGEDGTTVWSIVVRDAVTDARVSFDAGATIRSTPSDEGTLRIELLL